MSKTFHHDHTEETVTVTNCTSFPEAKNISDILRQLGSGRAWAGF